MTVNGVKIAILGTALHVHHTFWDIYLPPLNYFDVNFPDFKILEGWKHNETIFYSFSVLYLDAALESLTSEKKFFAKLGSVFLFNSLFPTLLPRFAHTFRAPRVVFAGHLVGKSIAIFFVLLTHQNSIVSTLGWLLGAICGVLFVFFWGAAGRYWDTFFNWSPAG